jgi:hypothetical protein
MLSKAGPIKIEARQLMVRIYLQLCGDMGRQAFPLFHSLMMPTFIFCRIKLKFYVDLI